MIAEQPASSGEKTDMGRVSVKFEVANYEDILAAKQGAIPHEKARRMEVEGVVDPGATRLILPESVVTQLGLTPEGTAKVKYADERTAIRPMVKNVWLQCLGRDSIFSAIVEPSRKTALIGAIVLEELDLLLDCATQRLIPRDPDTIISEAE